MSKYSEIQHQLDEVSPIPKGIPKIYLLGDTGAGKTTFIRKILGTENSKFPTTRQLRTTVAPTEYVICKSTNYELTVLLKPFDEINGYVREILKEALEKSLLVEVVVMSRNSPDTGIRVLNTIRYDRLDITRSAFTAGETVADYLDAFDVDLFLTTNVEDEQKVIDSRFCAAAILKDPPSDASDIPEGQVRIAFDGDAVLFSDESELVYKTQGMAAFHAPEDAQQDIPMAEGPYATLLKK
ncbi:5'-nucleotidase [Salmonella enterica subsp. enterica]|uniref:5'-nucleotidase n=2 Tax=Salmonella enterica TaxID=28901 RepID=A0A379VHT4_SALET|nr:5'-nucleotidase [Salmonella enterica subsp. enterica]